MEPSGNSVCVNNVEDTMHSIVKLKKHMKNVPCLNTGSHVPLNLKLKRVRTQQQCALYLCEQCGIQSTYHSDVEETYAEYVLFEPIGVMCLSN